MVAVCVPAPDGVRPTLDDLRAFARDQLAAAHLPRELRIVDTIPRSGGGKALRRLLRDSPPSPPSSPEPA